MNRLLTFLVLLALVVGVSPLFGQATDGNIIGTVVDQSGGVVAKATVDLESATTGVKRTTETDSAGVYRFNNLLVGSLQHRGSRGGLHGRVFAECGRRIEPRYYSQRIAGGRHGGNPDRSHGSLHAD